jgi:hypothetical protein
MGHFLSLDRWLIQEPIAWEGSVSRWMFCRIVKIRLFLLGL